MPKARPGPQPKVSAGCGPPKSAKADNHSEPTEGCDFTSEVGGTGRTLRWCRGVLWGRAFHRRGHPRIGQFQAVISADRFGLGCEACSMQSPKQPLPTAVTGQHSSRSICSVGRRSQTEHQDLSRRVTETGDTRPPISLILIGRFAGNRNLGPPLHESRTPLTLHHFALHSGEDLTTALVNTGDLHITIVSEPQ